MVFNLSFLQVIRRILESTQPSDSIELGLHLGAIDPKTGLPIQDRPSPPSPNANVEPPLLCTIRISHKFEDEFASSLSDRKSIPPSRPQPVLSGPLLSCLLYHIGANLVPDLPPPAAFKHGRTCNFILPLRRGSSSMASTPLVGQLVDEDPMAGEPSIEQLVLFAEGLKGKKVTLYASPGGSFSQHLTRYLAAWGMEITHVSPESVVSRDAESPVSSKTPLEPLPSIAQILKQGENGTPGSSDPSLPSSQPSFIFIDDDIEVLKERLRLLRSEKSTISRKRPSLAALHRPRSSPQIARSVTTPCPLPTSVVIVHFTSISNYKRIKDVVHSIISSHTASAAPIPEVMIIPKPAGPRRFLTALYTAMMKPVVDPFFSPIATTPTTPTSHPAGSFFHSYNQTEKKSNTRAVSKTPRPASSRNGSDRSSQSAKDITDLCRSPTPVSSPLVISENMEYFPEATVQLGTSPSSGLVIQSPDGQPAGIFFHPRQRSQRTPSTHSMERDKGQLQVPPTVSVIDPAGKRSPSKLSVTTTCENGPSSVSPASLSYLRTMTASPLPVVSPRSGAGKPSRRSFSSASREGQAGSQTETPRKRSSTDAVMSPGKGKGPVLGDSEDGPARRMPRRTSVEGTHTSVMAAASKQAKAAGDGNIVPPISVLIVDGEFKVLVVWNVGH